MAQNLIAGSGPAVEERRMIRRKCITMIKYAADTTTTMALDSIDEEELGASIYKFSRTAKLLRAKKEKLLAASKTTKAPFSVDRSVDEGGVCIKRHSAGVCARHGANDPSCLPPPVIDAPASISNPHVHNMRMKDIKPQLKVGEKVCAAWWEDEIRDGSPSWYPGTIKSYKEVDSVGQQYGPLRLYGVEYDDGDELDGVEDRYVFSKADYLLHMQNGGEEDTDHNWIGVKNVLDSESSDGWASSVGWYNATMIDGQEQSFSLLSDALSAYDASVIHAKEGAQTEVDPSDLNLPEEFEGKEGVKTNTIGSDDNDESDSDSYVNHGTTDQPTSEVLKWNCAMPRKRLRKNVVTGLKVKVRFDDNEWYGGVIAYVMKKGHQIEIKFDDGTTEVSKFPDNDVIIDDKWNCTMSRKKQRRNVVAGLRVKALSDDNMWYGGVVACVVNEGHQIEIKFDDGTTGVSDFPNNWIIVDDQCNVGHHTSRETFIPPLYSNDSPESASDDRMEEDDSSANGGSIAITSDLASTTSNPANFQKNRTISQKPNRHLVRATKKRKQLATERVAKKQKQQPPSPIEVVPSKQKIAHMKCSTKSFNNRTNNERVCFKDGVNRRYRLCSIAECTHHAVKRGVCIRHGAKLKPRVRKICKHEGCSNQTQQGGVCIKHGASKTPKTCSSEGCTNIVVQGGVCLRHGAKVKACSHEGCTTYAKNGGVCVKHGAEVKFCKHEGCSNRAKQGGVCIKHGAKMKPCSHEGCTNKIVQGGVCMRHGAKIKTRRRPF
eukprot:CAMPEP_0202004042 /NCGR_PEP_ID=MMETSP0905-20130828/9464_1 /ASSEMBLY_ACC=CAM_ASM_000554 /TAXON_ID=420261 /ORGANISM="Thalassiosira antarctica, Strain CCMP982" /LENGTH=771 /DNA_ID=CAMNT_0048561297 /DNA_START=15 /DNA_END=2330 /DNA_ORIENTATION=-